MGENCPLLLWSKTCRYSEFAPTKKNGVSCTITPPYLHAGMEQANHPILSCASTGDVLLISHSVFPAHHDQHCSSRPMNNAHCPNLCILSGSLFLSSFAPPFVHRHRPRGSGHQNRRLKMKMRQCSVVNGRLSGSMKG